MLLDLLKSNMMTKMYTREQFVTMMENMKKVDIIVSHEQVFGIEKEYIKYEQKLDVPNPKLLAKVQSKVSGSIDPPSSFMTHAFSSTYNMTLLKSVD